MKGLIKFELINIFKSVSFLVCGILMAVLSFVSVMVVNFQNKIFGEDNLAYILGYECDGEHFLVTAAQNSNFVLLTGIVVCIAVCSGYSQKTYRNIWARGFSRGQVFMAKMISTSAASAVFALISMLVSFITATVLFGVGDDWQAASFLVIELEFLMCIGVAISFTALAFICKNMGLSIVLAVILPSLLSLGAGLIDIILMFKEIDLKVSKFVLTNAMQYMANKPYDGKVILESTICLVAYIVLSFGLGYIAMKNDEI